MVLRHDRLEPPYCAASLVARAAIDYTAALFFGLRWAMKPRPAKPISTIAQVDGSGTAAAMPEIRGWSNVPTPAEDVSD
jgi:hypothetical protein